MPNQIRSIDRHGRVARRWAEVSMLLLLCSAMTSRALLRVSTAAEEDTMRAYVGTYTRGESQGIYLLNLNKQTGLLTLKGLAGEAVNPSFLAVSPAGDRLYAVGEVGSYDGQKSGAVAAFRISAESGLLTRLNERPSGGPGACHLIVDAADRNVLVANYSGGSVAVLPLTSEGSLGDATSFVQHQGSSLDPRRQKGPHAHSINLDSAGRFAFVADLGLDKILVYRFDGKRGKLTPNDPPSVALAPGSGPRHFAFHPNGKYAYVINELASTVTSFRYNAKRGVLQEIQSITTLPPILMESNFTAEIQVHPSGKFVYGSNRGHDSIAVFAVDSTTGTLSLVEHESARGKTPRNFCIDPTGRFMLVANQDSDNIVAFRIDTETGRLTPTGSEVSVASPVCIKFAKIGH